jgi:hypothetical protein
MSDAVLPSVIGRREELHCAKWAPAKHVLDKTRLSVIWKARLRDALTGM